MGTLENKIEPCGWCSGNSILNIGAGAFQDFDSDLSYGFPVCGGCGGLGITMESEEFKAATKRIMSLRFEYCPVDDKGPSLPLIIQLQKLEQLEYEITALYRQYGQKNNDCLAQSVAQGTLQPTIRELRETSNGVIKILEEAIEKSNYPPNTAEEATQLAILEAHKGKVEEAERQFAAAIATYNNHSVVVHDYGAFILKFKRSYEQALPWFEKATQLEPQKIVHFRNLASCFHDLNRKEEALSALEKALYCPDLKKEDEIVIKKMLELRTATN